MLNLIFKTAEIIMQKENFGNLWKNLIHISPLKRLYSPKNVRSVKLYEKQ
jgi:hypothetical protein